MKKVLIALVVLLFSVSVYAESRLDLSGQMRIQAFSFENFGDWNDDTKSDEEDYFKQRLRIYGKINVAEGISVHLRFDFAEEEWGTEGGHSDTNIDEDRAFIQIDKDMYRLRAGRQLFALGNYIAVDLNGVGFLATLKTPVALTLGYVKVSEGNGLSDESDLGSEDITVYVANANYKNEFINVNGFFGYEDGGDYNYDKGTYYVDNGERVYPNVVGYTADGNEIFSEDVSGKGELKNEDGTSNGEYNRWVLGLQADGKVGLLGYNLEFNHFSGEIDDEDMDYVGDQFYGDIYGNIGIFKVGAELFYAMGTDDENETQITNLGGEYGLWDDFVPMGGFADTDVMDLAFASDYENHGVFRLGENAGSVGAVPYVQVTPIDKLTLGAHVGYFEPEEDSVTNLDSVMVAVLTADYKLYDNVGLRGHFAYVSPDVNSNGVNDDFYSDDEYHDDEAMGFFGKLYVNF